MLLIWSEDMKSVKKELCYQQTCGFFVQICKSNHRRSKCKPRVSQTDYCQGVVVNALKLLSKWSFPSAVPAEHALEVLDRIHTEGFLHQLVLRSVPGTVWKGPLQTAQRIGEIEGYSESAGFYPFWSHGILDCLWTRHKAGALQVAVVCLAVPCRTAECWLWLKKWKKMKIQMTNWNAKSIDKISLLVVTWGLPKQCQCCLVWFSRVWNNISLVHTML